MGNKEEMVKKNSFKREIVLIFIGALIGTIPALISTYLQSKGQLNQLIMNHKISAIKEFSESFNTVVYDLMPKLEKLEQVAIQLSESKVDEFPEQFVDDFWQFENELHEWGAKNNTHILVINAMFQISYPLIDFHNMAPQSDASDTTGTRTAEQTIITMKEKIVSIRGNLIKLIELNNEILHDLSASIGS